MTKSLTIVVLIALAVVAAAQDQQDKKDMHMGGEAGAKKRMAAVGAKDFDIKKLHGKWYEIASSAPIQSLLKGCSCNQMIFSGLGENKLHVNAGCRNATSNKIVSVNGTLTQVRPQENKSLFELRFIEKKGVETPKVKLNQTEAEKVAQLKGEKGDKSSEGVVFKAKDDERDIDKKGKAATPDYNTVVLKTSPNFDSIVMASPALNSAWILAKKPTLDDKLFNDYIKFLEQNGFSSKLNKINQQGCEGKEVLKGKSSEPSKLI